MRPAGQASSTRKQQPLSYHLKKSRPVSSAHTITSIRSPNSSRSTSNWEGLPASELPPGSQKLQEDIWKWSWATGLGDSCFDFIKNVSCFQE